MSQSISHLSQTLVDQAQIVAEACGTQPCRVRKLAVILFTHESPMNGVPQRSELPQYCWEKPQERRAVSKIPVICTAWPSRPWRCDVALFEISVDRQLPLDRLLKKA
jgi:hypothetical protein